MRIFQGSGKLCRLRPAYYALTTSIQPFTTSFTHTHAHLSLAGAATSIIFVATETCFSRQTCVCRDKTFAATKLCCRDKHTFVATKDVCSDKNILSVKKDVCGDKNM